MIEKQLKPVNQDAKTDVISSPVYQDQYNSENQEDEEEEDEEDIINLDEYVVNYDSSHNNEKKDDYLTSAEGTKNEEYGSSIHGSGNQHIDKKQENASFIFINKVSSHGYNKFNENNDKNLKRDQTSSERNQKVLSNVSSGQFDNVISSGQISSRNNIINGNESDSKASRTVLTRITEKLYDNFVNNTKSKLSIYDYLVHDENIKRFIDKNDQNSNSKKINEFMQRNQGYIVKSLIKKQENLEKSRQKMVNICHGKPNNKDFRKDNVRNFNEFINDQMNFVSTRNTKLVELKRQQTNKEQLLSSDVPKLSASSNRIATSKLNESSSKNVHERLNKTPLNKLKTHKSKEPKKIPEHKKNKSISIVNYGHKKNVPSISINQIKNNDKHNDSIKKEESSNRNLNSRGTRENRILSPKNNISVEKRKSVKINTQQNTKEITTSVSSKTVMLEKFLKNYELCLLNIFNVKYGATVNLYGFSKILNQLGFITNDISSDFQKNDDEKVETLLTNLNSFSKLQMKTRVNENVYSREKELTKDCWNTINKENSEKIDSNLILIFLSSISGLYDGEEKIEDINNTDRNVVDHNVLKKLIPEINFDNYKYSRATVKQYKITFKELYENRMNFIMEAKRKSYAEKRTHPNQDLIFKPKLDDATNKRADLYRKRCINEVNYEVNDPNALNVLKLQEIYQIKKQKKENELAKLRAQKEEEELKDCTFQPKSKSRAKSTKDIVDKLYVDAFVRENDKLLKQKQREFEVKKIDEQHTFSPEKVNLKPHIFEKNPLKNDEHLKRGIERLERARIEKKIYEVQTTKGIATQKDLRNIEVLIREENYPSLKFGIDSSFKKKTIQQRTKSVDRMNRDTNLIQESKEEIYNTTSHLPMFILDINIDDLQKEKLEVYPYDNPEDVSYNFCEKHKLDEDKKAFLKKLIEDKINENKKRI